MKTARLAIAILFVCAVGLLPLRSYAQPEKPAPDVYTGVAMGTGGVVGGRSAQFTLRITSYTTDAELQDYAAVLREKGQDALTKILQKQDHGRVFPVGGVGNAIAVAYKRQDGADTILTIVTVRRMSFRELYYSGRSTGYPFGYMQLKLNAQGEGGGQIMPAAKIRFDKKTDTYEIESFGNPYIQATNVRPSK